MSFLLRVELILIHELYGLERIFLISLSFSNLIRFKNPDPSEMLTIQGHSGSGSFLLPQKSFVMIPLKYRSSGRMLKRLNHQVWWWGQPMYILIKSPGDVIPSQVWEAWSWEIHPFFPAVKVRVNIKRCGLYLCPKGLICFEEALQYLRPPSDRSAANVP